jgi:hypothetical protein
MVPRKVRIKVKSNLENIQSTLGDSQNWMDPQRHASRKTSL